jgi:hypothetical protein
MLSIFDVIFREINVMSFQTFIGSYFHFIQKQTVQRNISSSKEQKLTMQPGAQPGFFQGGG